MVKDHGAFLTIGELARDLGVAQHILRYWESRFPQLRPLQRSGNRRYYRPADVEVARRIHRLLNEDGFTVRGAQRLLAGRKPQSDAQLAQTMEVPAPEAAAAPVLAPAPQPQPPQPARTERRDGLDHQRELPMEGLSHRAGGLGTDDMTALVARLTSIRETLQDALKPR